MSGRPYTYSRAMAIAQLMRDMRRPVLKKIVEENKERYEYLVNWHEEHKTGIKPYGPRGLETVYLYGEDVFVSYQDTIDWVPKLTKVGPDGSAYGSIIEGWPTEEEIAACIAESAEREAKYKDNPNALWVNDAAALQRLKG